MATAEQMAVYAAVLSEYKPAQDKPVTEIVIFQLKEPQSATTLAHFESQIIENTRSGKGIKKQSWGFSLTDPNFLVWMLDWDKIQDHWDFWQTPAFNPVIQTIAELFVEGRPLVRHYNLQPPGMLEESFQWVYVWDEKVHALDDGTFDCPHVEDQKHSKATKIASAVDKDETNWRCAVSGYQSQESAEADKIPLREGMVGHLVKLKFAAKDQS